MGWWGQLLYLRGGSCKFGGELTPIKVSQLTAASKVRLIRISARGLSLSQCNTLHSKQLCKVTSLWELIFIRYY